MRRSTLQHVLMLPFVVLLLGLGAVTYWTAARSGETASQEFSRGVLLALAARVLEATERQLLAAHVALKSLIPDPITSPLDAQVTTLPFPEDLRSLEERVWVATGFFPHVISYAYFGTEDGRFIGVSRRPETMELRLKPNGNGPRSIYRTGGPGQAIDVIREDDYDPRTRPWFRRALERNGPVWSDVYSDFSTLEPTITLARPVYRRDGTVLGVGAVDLALTDLTRFFTTLSLSRGAVAYIMENKGAIIATSTGEQAVRTADGVARRLNAAQSQSAVLRESYAVVAGWLDTGRSLTAPVSDHIYTSIGEVQLAAARLRDPAGLEWIAVVAVPRADFLTGLSTVLFQGLAIGLVAVLIVLILGFSLLHWVLRDIRKLTDAVRQVGKGEPLGPLDIHRADEIGELASSFREMERNLRTDSLTGVLNRESLLAQTALRIRKRTHTPFALLFIDLDGFKAINDTHGHDAGDRILVEIARRLRLVLRATDSIARFGGDEFVVYLEGPAIEQDTETIKDKIVTAIEAPVDIPGAPGTTRVGASIGTAFFPADGKDLDTLLKVADTRMFESKRERKERQHSHGEAARSGTAVVS